MWDCLKCGTKNILGLSHCPHCRAPRPTEDVPAVPDSSTEESVPPTAQAEEQEPQAPSGSKGKSSAKN